MIPSPFFSTSLPIRNKLSVPAARLIRHAKSTTDTNAPKCQKIIEGSAKLTFPRSAADTLLFKDADISEKSTNAQMSAAFAKNATHIPPLMSSDGQQEAQETGADTPPVF